MEAEFEAVGDADETEGGEDRIGEEALESESEAESAPIRQGIHSGND